MKIVGGPRKESYALYAVAGALLLGGPVWHYLYTNHYSFTRPEATAIVAIGSLAGVVAAVISRRIGGIVGALGIAVLLFLFVDLQTDLHLRFGAKLIFAVMVVVSLLLGAHKARLLAITLGAFYLAALPRAAVGTTVTVQGESGRSGSPSDKVLLHVILDEHWGVGGLRAAGDTGTAGFLTDYYLSRGFTLFTGAYSRYYATIESIPAMVSMGQTPALSPVDTTRPHSREFKSVPYFAWLREAGYTIRVFQNLFLNFCLAPAHAVNSCETQSGNSIANIGFLGGSPVTRGFLATRYLLNMTSHIYDKLQSDAVSWKRASAGSGLGSLVQLEEVIASKPPGSNAYFVHVLLPHKPLETDADCGVASPRDRVAYDEPLSMSDSAWRHILKMERAQIRCAELALSRVLATLDSTVGRENSTILIHGDHGPRIFQHRPDSLLLSSLNALQLNSRYSTLLAVRGPGFAPGIVRDPVPMQDFVWQFARQGFRGPLATSYNHFVLTRRNSNTFLADSIRVLSQEDMPWSVTDPQSKAR